MTTPTLGALIHSFFVDYLQAQKGLRLASVRSYRDAIRLFLGFVAREARSPITRLSLRRSHLRTCPAIPPAPRARTAQSHPDPQPAAGRLAHLLRVRGPAGAGDARNLRAGHRHPGQASRASGDSLPGSGRGLGASAWRAFYRQARGSRSRPSPVPVQHGCAGPGGG